MTIGAALIGMAMLVFASLVVIRPLRKTEPQPRVASDETGSDYDTTLLALRDLEFDYQLHVVSDEDYARLKGQLMTEAAQALERQVAACSRIDEVIETAVRAKRGLANQAVSCLHCQEALSPDDKFCSQCGRIAEIACPVCKQAGTPGDNFCTGCGTALNGALDFAPAAERSMIGK
ncbi:MAG: zinc ribbon domain-containing protein [Candidatus Promineifilaceae bacterium]